MAEHEGRVSIFHWDGGTEPRCAVRGGSAAGLAVAGDGRLVFTLQSLAEPVEVDGHLLNASCSIGIAVYPDDGRDFAELLKNADAARVATLVSVVPSPRVIVASATACQTCEVALKPPTQTLTRPRAPPGKSK